MSWTRHHFEKLRHRVDEIDDLGYKEQEHCFTEVTENGDNSKRHPREIAECVSDKYIGRVPEEILVRDEKHIFFITIRIITVTLTTIFYGKYIAGIKLLETH